MGDYSAILCMTNPFSFFILDFIRANYSYNFLGFFAVAFYLTAGLITAIDIIIFATLFSFCFQFCDFQIALTIYSNIESLILPLYIFGER